MPAQFSGLIQTLKKSGGVRLVLQAKLLNKEHLDSRLSRIFADIDVLYVNTTHLQTKL